MPKHQTSPLREQGASPVSSKACATAAEVTIKDPVREALVNFSRRIESERVLLAFSLAERFESTPSAAVGFQPALRDLRLFGREIARLAFGGEK